jgi:uncharacterized YigZ family protein
MNSEKPDSYLTIRAISEGVFKDKGSKFFGFAIPFENTDNLKIHLEEIKAAHPKASHFCYAYKIDENTRANDDGEPNGSAGKPILNSILSQNLNHILIIIVRYFGGTLLGVAGLINAYKSASMVAIFNAEIIQKYKKVGFLLKFDFEKINVIMKIVKEFDINIITQYYSNKCELKIEIRQSLVEIVLTKIKELRFEDLEIVEIN